MLSFTALLSRPVTRSGLLALLGVAAVHSSGMAQTSWPMAGGDISNDHAWLSPPANIGLARQINPATVKNLKVKWSLETYGDISATPTVEAGGLYVTDWAGYLYKVNPTTGAKIWELQLCTYRGNCNTNFQAISRNSPAIGTNNVIVGDAVAHPTEAKYGSLVYGVGKSDGKVKWATVVNNTSKYGSVLGSPVIYNNVVYVGTASWEEGVTDSDATYLPTFRGNVTALNPDTGAILKQFFTVPAGYTGGALPGTMSIWPAQNALLVATGNNYSVPADVATCLTAAGKDYAKQTACFNTKGGITNYVDAMISLDLNSPTLAPKWGRRLYGPDTWTLSCWTHPERANCPKPTGADVDFAQGPMLAYVPNFQVADDHGGTTNNYLLGAGQKNSVFYGLNPMNGGVVWRRFVGTGGMEWGSAVNIADRNMLYFALHNPQRVSQTIIGKGGTAPQTWDGGAWGALDIRTGAPKWTVPATGKDLVTSTSSPEAPGCVTFANRVLFAGSSSGIMSAIDATTGYVYWNYATGGTVVSCPAIFDERVYWGTGYARHGLGKHFLYAFSVNGA